MTPSSIITLGYHTVWCYKPHFFRIEGQSADFHMCMYKILSLTSV